MKSTNVRLLLGARVSILAVPFLVAGLAHAVTVYDPGVAPPAAGLIVGDHLVSPQPHPSVAGVGGSGISNNGDALNGARTYTYDFGAQPDLTDGIANRGDDGFAMLIWDMGQPLTRVRLYTHQDHYNGGPITDPFQAQDVMEYSVWGSNDGDNFVLLSDVVAFDIAGGGPGLPTYTVTGSASLVIYRGGSAEFGAVNAYTRDYTFPTAWRYIGVRTSQISLDASDADPEIDAIVGIPGSGQATQIGCEVLSLEPPRVEVTFEISNTGGIPICSVHLTPLEPDPPPEGSCDILECSSPAGWDCGIDPATGGASWHVLPGAACIDEGQSTGVFDIVLDPFVCCYKIEFNDENGIVFFSDTVCFECDKPVQIDQRSWGSIKARYR